MDPFTSSGAASLCRALSAVLLALLLQGCFGGGDQEPAEPRKEEADTTGLNPPQKGWVNPEYIQRFPDAVTVTGFAGRTELTLKIKEKGVDQDLELESNPPADVGVSVGWWLFGGSASFATSTGNEEKGDTESANFSWTYYGPRLTLDLMYYQYSGFFHEDDLGNIELFEDLTIRGGAVTGSYAFNGTKFSTASVFKHNERQKKSMGSFYLFASLSTLEIVSPNSMIPVARTADFVEFQTLRNVGFVQAAAGGGYGYTFVFRKNWYVHASGQIGGGVHQFDYDSNQDADGSDTFVRAILRASVGYNGEVWFLGATGLIDSFNNRLDEGSIEVARNRFLGFVGRRF
jgi:hypothetical protein